MASETAKAHTPSFKPETAMPAEADPTLPGFVRVTVRLAEGVLESLWAKKGAKPSPRGNLHYFVHDAEGTKLPRIVIAAPCDIVSEVPARLNLKYVKMEVVS